MTAQPWNLGSDKTVASDALARKYIYDRINTILQNAGISNSTEFSNFATYLGYSSGGGSVQDMQVAWTPTNVALGPLMGYAASNANVPLNGILTLTFNHAFNLEGYSIGGGANTLQSISFPNLASVGEAGFSSNGISVSNCGAITTISAPVLTIIRGGINIGNNPSLTTLSLPVLGTVEGAITINNNGITALSLPSVTGSGVNALDCSGSPLLASVSIPVFLPPNTITISFNGCGLNAASVNAVLARCVANAGYVAGLVDLTGGTSAAPSGQGIADKATLIGRGATVNTN